MNKVTGINALPIKKYSTGVSPLPVVRAKMNEILVGNHPFAIPIQDNPT